MIIDKLENLSLYKNIPDIVVKFLQTLPEEIKLGKQILSEDIYVNIEKYTTKLSEDAKFEAHKKYIDIQILLNGQEQIHVTDKKSLHTSIPYNNEKDIIFYSDPIKEYPAIKLDGTNFIMLFPHEAHAPQVSIAEDRQEVLKVVVKIKTKD